MTTYLFKTSVRYLTQNKLFTSINLVCIVIGLTCSTLLFLYVKNEFDADKFFPSYESIYHVDTNWGNSLALSHGNVLKKNLPEIEAITLYQSTWSDQTIVKYNKNDYTIDNAIYADSGFFNVFEYSVYQGNLIDAFVQPYSIILTKKQALKIFGSTNPIDQIVELKTSHFGISKYTVKAVLEDLPNNCSFNFDMVLPLSDLMNIEWYKTNADHWGTCNYSAFVKLTKGTQPKILEQKAGLAFLGDAPEWVHDIVPIKFNALNNLHFNSDASDGVFIANNKFIVILLGAIGSLILLIAGINYLNLNMSKTDENAKEWNIKRTIGATKMQLMLQSLLSSIIIILIGITLSGFLIVSLLPAFNLYTQSSFQIANIVTPENTYLLGGVMLFSLLLFGIIPALISSNQPIINAIKTTKSSTGHTKKYNLVVFQFCISTLLIIGSLVIYKQNNLLMNHNSGYKTNNILYIQLNQEAREKSEFLESEFEKIANVDKVAFSNGIFGTNDSNWGRSLYYEGNEIEVEFAVYSASYDFFDLFELNITDGNRFDKNSIKNRDLIVNEAFIKKYEISSILGASLQQNRKQQNVIGVVEDFNHDNLYNSIEPLAFECSENANRILFASVKNNSPKQLNETLNRFKEIWETVSPNYPMNYEFMQQHHKNIYEKEFKLMKLIIVASLLSIIMAALGLFGLSYYFIGKRIKEIGIRKVNGAKTIEILQLLNLDFIKWVIIAFIVAAPTGYIVMTKWLENFAYKTTLSWWVFAIAGFTVLIIALITVSWQTFRAARRNPVEALRYE